MGWRWGERAAMREGETSDRGGQAVGPRQGDLFTVAVVRQAQHGAQSSHSACQTPIPFSSHTPVFNDVYHSDPRCTNGSGVLWPASTTLSVHQSSTCIFLSVYTASTHQSQESPINEGLVGCHFFRGRGGGREGRR